jgi:branched-chain amino acid transport system substrate-binding protein
MNKRYLIFVLSLILVGASLASACGQAAQPAIVIGVNAPLTGDIPKVGEGTKFAAEMWLEDINAAGGLEVGGKKYPVELAIEDNESKAESATKANTKLITQDEVLVIVGPQSSKQAVPAGGVANDNETPMVSPWSTNPATTKDRPWVFRTPFLDPFQGPVVANFVSDEFGFTVITRKGWPSSSREPGRTSTGLVLWWLLRALRPRTRIFQPSSPRSRKQGPNSSSPPSTTTR